MDISAPILNSVIPIISATDDTKKTINSFVAIVNNGVSDIKKTIATMGIIDTADSLNFYFKSFIKTQTSPQNTF